MKTGVLVHDAMTKKPITVSPDASLKKCSELMEKNNIGSVLVEDNKNLIGIITEQDVVRKVVAKGINPIGKKAKDFMSTDVATIEPGMDVFDALNKMKDKDVKTLPVKDDGNVVGILALKDVLKIQPSLFELWVEKMRIRDENTKPIFKTNPKEGICEACGEYFQELLDINGSLLCKKCKEEQE